MLPLRRPGLCAVASLALAALLAGSAPSFAEPSRSSASASAAGARSGGRADASAGAKGGARAERARAERTSARAKAGQGSKEARAGQGRQGSKQKEKEPKVEGTLSVGAPNRGRLVGGARLKGSKHVEVRQGARTWGLPVLVRALQRASARVVKKHGASVLLVGDLSKKGGGPLDGHHSHQSGRDVDVGFYTVNSRGKPVHLERFVAFDSEGKAAGASAGPSPSWARFDDARNWAFVEALLSDKEAQVRYIIVSSPLRARLLAHAAKKKVKEDLLVRATAALISPGGEADLHDDHFHVRIACPEAMRGACIEESLVRGGGATVVASERSEVTPAAHTPEAAGAAQPAPREAREASTQGD